MYIISFLLLAWFAVNACTRTSTLPIDTQVNLCIASGGTYGTLEGYEGGGLAGWMDGCEDIDWLGEDAIWMQSLVSPLLASGVAHSAGTL